MKYLGRRLFEGMLFPILMSLFFALVLIAGIYANESNLAVVAFLLTLAYSIYELPKHLFAVRNRKKFYITNFTVQAIILAITVILAIFKLGNIYTYFFMQYTAFQMFGLPRVLSAVLVNLIFALIILLTPKFAMKRRTKLDR